MAELVWTEGVLIKEFPPESYTIKNIDDAFAFLKTDDGQKRSDFVVLLIKLNYYLFLHDANIRLEYIYIIYILNGPIS